jgi:hypothetical protein
MKRTQNEWFEREILDAQKNITVASLDLESDLAPCGLSVRFANGEDSIGRTRG